MKNILYENRHMPNWQWNTINILPQ
jgi:hypothetical protein